MAQAPPEELEDRLAPGGAAGAEPPDGAIKGPRQPNDLLSEEAEGHSDEERGQEGPEDLEQVHGGLLWSSCVPSSRAGSFLCILSSTFRSSDRSDHSPLCSSHSISFPF